LGGIKFGLFSFILKEELLKIEVSGFCIAMTTDIKKKESLSQSADRLTFKEQQNRKSRYYSWIRSIKIKDNSN
tara:strand:- start:77 stop:295 length:219 start_codon:yes stop_codon:yes gene_type:complete